MIDVTVDRTDVMIGESVRVSGTWQHAKQPRSLALRLRWRTEGRGSSNSQVVDAVVFPGEQMGRNPIFEAHLTVPPTGPASYDGTLIRVLWFVEVRLDIAWAADPKQEIGLRVLPAQSPPVT